MNEDKITEINEKCIPLEKMQEENICVNNLELLDNQIKENFKTLTENNNYRLQYQNVDYSLNDVDQRSNASSLESRNSLTNHQGSHADDETESGSTSCSEDSFEMSSSSSYREFLQTGQLITSNQHSMHNTKMAGCKIDEKLKGNEHCSLRTNFIDERMELYSPGQPKTNNYCSSHLEKHNTDFEKLETELVDAVEHCNITKTKIDNYLNNKNMTKSGEDFENLELGQQIQRSKSLPGIEGLHSFSQKFKKIAELQKKIGSNSVINNDERLLLLVHESYRVEKMALERANAHLVEYQRRQPQETLIPRQSRQYLSKMKVCEIRKIYLKMQTAINLKNSELVQLLLERDNLHMEHDSLRIDIADFTQEKSPLVVLNMKHLFCLQNNLEVI